MYNFKYISILLPTVIAQTQSLSTPTPTITPALLQIFDGVTASPDQITSELAAYSRHLTLFAAYGAFTQDVAHFITDSWPTNPPAALSSLYSSWSANDEQIPDFYTAAVSFFESVTKVNAAISMGLIGPSQFSYVVSYIYTAPLPSSDFFPPDALRANVATLTAAAEGPVGEAGGIGVEGGPGVTCVLTTSDITVPANTLTSDGSPSFPTSVPDSLTSLPKVAPVFTSGQSQTGAEGGNPTPLPGIGTEDPFRGNWPNVYAGSPLPPVTPASTRSVSGFASFTTGQVQTGGGEGDVSAIPGVVGSLTGAGFTIIEGPSDFPVVQPGTIIEPVPNIPPGQAQTQEAGGSASGVFLIETGTGFTIFDAPDLTAPITLFDAASKTGGSPGMLVTQIVTITVSAVANTTQANLSSSSSSATSNTPVSTISSAAGVPARGLGFTHPKVISRLRAAVVGCAGLMLGFWMD